jgi:phosphonatase-like hydrolase
MRTRLVVFDIAGTTVRDKGNVAESFLSALGAVGLHISVEDANRVMGYRKTEAIRMLLDKYRPEWADKEHIDQIHDLFEEKMLSFYMADRDLAPLPHAEDIFRWLHANNIRVAINTGFTRHITEGILYRLQWKDNPLIDAVICSDEVPEGRPAPFMIRKLMDQLGVTDAADVVKVGDTEVDISEGRNAGCGKVISVTTGASTRAQLGNWNPDHIIDDLSQLPQLLP